MKNPTELDITERNPWAVLGSTTIVNGEATFEDNFNPLSNSHLTSTTTTCLPDSKQYLATLERRLSRVQTRCVRPQDSETETKCLQSKDILKALTLKRAALIEQVDYAVEESLTPPTMNSVQSDEQSSQSLSSLITKTNIYNTMEKKFCPHLHALNAEELQKLVDADVLEHVTDYTANQNTQTLP